MSCIVSSVIFVSSLYIILNLLLSLFLSGIKTNSIFSYTSRALLLTAFNYSHDRIKNSDGAMREAFII